MKFNSSNLFKGILNIFFLIITGRIFGYISIEKVFNNWVENVDNILIISGGKGIEKLKQVDLDTYDLIIFNSYNTCLNIPLDFWPKLDQYPDVKFFYYQAPFHLPLNLLEHQAKIEKVITLLPKHRSVSFVDYLGKVSYKKLYFSLESEAYQFRPLGFIDNLGFKWSNKSGVLSILGSLQTNSGLKVDLIGCDFNWYQDDEFIMKNGLLETLEFSLFTMREYKKITLAFESNEIQINFITKSSLELI
tara:strand:+ start:13145 stop:13885 length:741 start_codon:yes stop_codon:yes gene_type:complete